MKSYIPIDITDDRLVSSSIDEPDMSEPGYSPTATYAKFGQVSVVDVDTHLVYESLVDANLGNPPETSPTKWVLRSYTNRFRMFEWNQGEPSVGQSPLSVVIRPGKRIDAVTLEGLKAATLDLTIRNGVDGPVVFTLDGYLLNRNINSFVEFFYSPFVRTKIVSTFAVPQVPDPVIYLTLSDPSGTVELSRFAVGQSTHLGNVQWSPLSTSENYSKVTWNDFGRATLKPIPSLPKTEQTIIFNANRINAIRQYKQDTDAKAAVWSALDDIDGPYTESLVVIGVHQNFDIDISSVEESKIDLSLKGV